MSDVFARQNLPLYIVFITGVIATASVFLEIPILKDVDSYLTNGSTIIAGFAIIVGCLSLIVRHIQILQRKQGHYWWLSAYLIILMMIYVVIGVGYGSKSSIYMFLYSSIIPNVTTAIWGLTGVFTFTSITRAMRIRSVEATILIIATIVFIFGNMPAGDALWSGFGPLKSWILNYPSNAGNRGFIIGSAIGAAIIALTTIIGRTRGWLGGGT